MPFLDDAQEAEKTANTRWDELAVGPWTEGPGESIIRIAVAAQPHRLIEGRVEVKGDLSAQGLLLTPGSLLDQFKVIRMVGRGSMGEVYLARDTVLGRKVAVKVVRPKGKDQPEAVERFLEEVRATARLNHPHIVTIYGVGTYQGMPYLAREFLEGDTLRHRLDDKRPGLREALRIGLAMAEALAEAHGHNIPHRDLNPENVVVGRDGRLRVLDFGLARLASDHKDESVPAEAAAADVRALGMILYELFSGDRPQEEEASDAPSGERPPRLELSEGVPPELVGLTESCLVKDPEQRPTAEAVAGVLSDLLLGGRPRPSEEKSPFRGLLPFAEQHADLFFGRTAEVAAFLERLRDQPVLPVVGPSGVGKSSFVRAGVIPRLREQERWVVLRLRPGSRPFRTLAARLVSDTSLTGGTGTYDGPATGDAEKRKGGGKRRPEAARDLAAELEERPGRLSLRLGQLAEAEGGRVLLFVDQAEELYTLGSTERVRRKFMEALCTAADDPQGPVRVIFTVREEFLSRLAEGAAVAEALGQVTVLAGLGPETLEEILVGPVQAMGYRYEDPELISEMIGAVRGGQAALPLLQFTGLMLWQRRDRDRRLLTRAAYEEIGGVAGALARHVEGVMAGLTLKQEVAAREIFLRLVTAEGTRRVVSRNDLLEVLGPEARPVLDRLTQARAILVRKGEEGPEFELVHESLVLTWKRLARWLEESRTDLTFLADAGRAAQLWDKRGRREEEVWQGEPLHDALKAAQRCSTAMPGPVTEFLEAGSKKEARTRRRRQALISFGIAVLLIIAAASVIVAFAFARKERRANLERGRAEQGRRQAEISRAEAQREGARTALMRGNILEARAKLRGSLTTRDSPLGRALWWTLNSDPLVWSRLLGGDVYDVAFSPDGRTVAAACADQSVYLYDIRTLAVQVLRGHGDQVRSVAFSPDGKLLASGTWDGRIWIWDLESGRSLHVLSGHTDTVRRLAAGPDGRLLVSASDDKTIRVWDMRTGTRKKVLRGHGDRVWAVAVSADGRMLASGSYDRTIRVWDLKTGVLKTVLRGHTRGVFGVAISPDGGFLVSGSADRTVRVWDPASGAQKKVLKGHTSRVSDVTISPDGKLVASAGRDNTIRVWDLTSGAQKRVLTSRKALTAVRFSPDGKLLVSGGTDKTLRVWDPAAPARMIRRRRAADGPAGKAFKSGTGAGVTAMAASGKWVVLGYRDGRLERVAAGGGNVEPSFSFEKVPSSPVVKVLAGPAKTLVAGFADGTLGIWSLVNGSRLEHVKLDGPVARIMHKNRRLHAITERGDHAVFDLSVFYEDYCDLIRKVWKKVKVVWEDGLPVLRPPPKNHRCASE